jgi:hypothetical protein
MTSTLLAPSMRLANEAIAKRIVAKVRDHSPALVSRELTRDGGRPCPKPWSECTLSVDAGRVQGNREAAVGRSD